MTHLKADVATYLPHRQNNRKKNFNIFMTHLKADVATYIEVFFSYYSVCEEKMFPHQPLNGSLKY
jgi:hypothetical protein